MQMRLWGHEHQHNNKSETGDELAICMCRGRQLLSSCSLSQQPTTIPICQLEWPEQDRAAAQLFQDLMSSQQSGQVAASALQMQYKDRGKSQLSGMTPSAAADW